MERTLTNFIRALRSSEVRVSTGEALDATRTVALIGYGDRALLKGSLGCVLAKSTEEKDIHDRLFDLYFSHSDSRTDTDASQSESQSEGDEPQAAPENLVDLLQSGDESAISTALERAAEAAGIDNIRFSTQVAYYAQQIIKQMGGEGLQERILEALQGREPSDEAEAQALIDIRRDLTMRARERAERAFDVFGAGETQQFRDDFAAEKRLNALDRYDMERMKDLIAKIAKRLAVKHSRRRRKRNRGQLDVRRTMRANAGLDGVPFNVIWRQKKKDRPKIVAICDVSGSVAQYVRFLLLLLYSLADAVPDIHAFAFSHRLKPVDDILADNEFEAAMAKIIRELGMGSTDYGQAWSDLKVDHESIIDRRTTVIVLGDGRSNYGDPRADLFRDFAQRAKSMIWLNPEGRALWGTGDSAIPRYLPFCTQMSHVATLKDLERAVDEVLSAYG
ncbi:MAG: VWA domain-containing protein [Hyphomonas sp.]